MCRYSTASRRTIRCATIVKVNCSGTHTALKLSLSAGKKWENSYPVKSSSEKGAKNRARI